MHKSKIGEMNIDNKVKDVSRNFVEKLSHDLSISLRNSNKGTINNDLHNAKELLNKEIKSFQKQLGNVVGNLSDVARNIVASPLYYKIIMTDILGAYNERNMDLTLKKISEGKLSEKQIEDRASGNDLRSFADRRIIDMLVGMGASPKLPLFIIPGPGMIGSPLTMGIESNNYNAVKALDKYPDTNYLMPKNFYKDGTGNEHYRYSRQYKDLACFATPFNGDMPAKFNQIKPIQDIKKELTGKELYLFVNTVNIKNHFLDKFKNMNTLVSKENGGMKLYSPLHILAENNKEQLTYNLVMSRGADIDLKNSNGDTPAHIAASSANLTFIKYAISKNADLNITNNAGKTPLELAKESLSLLNPNKGLNNFQRSDYNDLKDIITLLTLNKSLQNDITNINGKNKQYKDIV
jgi:hypothetical protein